MEQNLAKVEIQDIPDARLMSQVTKKVKQQNHSKVETQNIPDVRLMSQVRSSWSRTWPIGCSDVYFCYNFLVFSPIGR
jgi:hypothetical protein